MAPPRGFADNPPVYVSGVTCAQWRSSRSAVFLLSSQEVVLTCSLWNYHIACPQVKGIIAPDEACGRCRRTSSFKVRTIPAVVWRLTIFMGPDLHMIRQGTGQTPKTTRILWNVIDDGEDLCHTNCGPIGWRSHGILTDEDSYGSLLSVPADNTTASPSTGMLTTRPVFATRVSVLEPFRSDVLLFY